MVKTPHSVSREGRCQILGWEKVLAAHDRTIRACGEAKIAWVASFSVYLARRCMSVGCAPDTARCIPPVENARTSLWPRLLCGESRTLWAALGFLPRQPSFQNFALGQKGAGAAFIALTARYE
jgi:hypothetical protein